MHESAEHAALVELFRHHPELATTLAERCGVATPAGCRARVGDPVQKPATLAPDVAIELLDEQGLRRMVLLVEVQRRIDREKLLSWPAYLWIERLRRGCDCELLVLATTAEVAAWANQTIRCGSGSLTRPLVLGPADVPRITDYAVALAQPALAVLSACMHSGAPDGSAVMQPALAALLTLRPEERIRYINLVVHALSDGQKLTIKEKIMIDEIRHQELLAVARAEGMETVRVFHRLFTEMGSQVAAYPNGTQVAEMFAGLFAEDEIEATKARAKGEVLLRLLERRGISVDDTTREIVSTMPERPTWRHLIDVWIDRVATANSMEEVFRDSDVDRT